MRFRYSYKNMAEQFANSEDPDQTQHFAASDLTALFANYPFRGLQTTVGYM